MAQQGFANDQRKAMLRAIHEREGRWDAVDPDTEVVSIGSEIGLSEDESYALFKLLVDEHYVDPGRVLQARGAMPGRTSRVVGRSDNFFRGGLAQMLDALDAPRYTALLERLADAVRLPLPTPSATQAQPDLIDLGAAGGLGRVGRSAVAL